MKKKKTSNWWVPLAITALLVTVVSNKDVGPMQTATSQAEDGEQENQNREGKKIRSVLLKTIGSTRGGIQYRKEFTLTNTNSKYTLAYSCVGWKCGCKKAEKDLEPGIAEEFLKNVETLKDQGESANCCDHAWTEINLSYSDRSSRKITVADLYAAVGAKLFNIACGTVESELKASVANRKVPGDLVITYDDMHPLSGGTTVVIRGNGSAERRVRSRKEAKAKATHTTISLRQLRELIQLLIELQAWEQHTPSRQPVADESRARLTISVSNQTSELWEWFNEMPKNNRLDRIRTNMLKLTSRR